MSQYADDPMGEALPDYVENALYDAFSLITIAICTEREAQKAGVAYFKIASKSGKIQAYEQVAC